MFLFVFKDIQNLFTGINVGIMLRIIMSRNLGDRTLTSSRVSTIKVANHDFA